MPYKLAPASREKLDAFLVGELAGVQRAALRVIARLEAADNPTDKSLPIRRVEAASRLFPRLRGAKVWELQLHHDVEAAMILNKKEQLIILFGPWKAGTAPWH